MHILLVIAAWLISATVATAENLPGVFSNITVDGAVRAGPVQDDARRFHSLFWDQLTQKLYAQSLMISEFNDIPDLALGWARGSPTAPSKILQNDLLGMLYFRGWGPNNTFACLNDVSPNYCRGGGISSRATEDRGDNASGSQLNFFTTSNSTGQQRERGYFDHNGRLMLLGQSQWNSSTEWPRPDAKLTIVANNNEPIMSVVQENDPTKGWMASANGSFIWYRRPLIGKTITALGMDQARGHVMIGTDAAPSDGARALIIAIGEQPSAVAGLGMTWIDGSGRLMYRKPAEFGGTVSCVGGC